MCDVGPKSFSPHHTKLGALTCCPPRLHMDVSRGLGIERGEANRGGKQGKQEREVSRRIGKMDERGG